MCFPARVFGNDSVSSTIFAANSSSLSSRSYTDLLLDAYFPSKTSVIRHLSNSILDVGRWTFGVFFFIAPPAFPRSSQEPFSQCRERGWLWAIVALVHGATRNRAETCRNASGSTSSHG